jgi:TrmH family RNA methyltransferase
VVVAIASRRHPLVTALRRLRRGEGPPGLCAVEGVHLVEEAVRAGCRVAVVLYTPAFAARPEGRRCLEAVAGAPSDPDRGGLPAPATIVPVSEAVLEAVRGVETPPGVLAVVRPVPRGAAVSARIGLALDGVQDPGNVGTMGRALLAFAGEGAPLLLGPGTADPWGAKALRASAGAVFRLACAREGDLASALGRWAEAGWRWWALDAHGGLDLAETPLAVPCGFVVGSEGRGLSPAVRERLPRLTIRTAGAVESLSAPQAATIALYEASRRVRAGAP